MDNSDKFLIPRPTGRQCDGGRKREEFKKLSEPLIKWFRENYDPHTMIIIDWDSARITSESTFVALTPCNGDEDDSDICFADDAACIARLLKNYED